jgi:hypothetical protein
MARRIPPFCMPGGGRVFLGYRSFKILFLRGLEYTPCQGGAGGILVKCGDPYDPGGELFALQINHTIPAAMG